MEWTEYKVLSEKTLSTEFHSGKQVENLLHGVIGIITELQELFDWDDEVNKKEEVADVFWYIALLDRELNINLSIPNFYSSPIQITNENIITQLFKTTSILLDTLKKKIYYNKDINKDDFILTVKNIFDSLSIFCSHNDIDINTILDTNIQKLKSRYGDKFSSEKAINRDLTQERVILEQ